MSRWLPYPLFSLLLILIWLLLQMSLAPGDILLAVVLGVALPWAMARLEPEPLRLRRPLSILRLAARVFVDIGRSNLAVAAIILGLRRGQRSGFLEIPLTLTSSNGLAALACILTSTPGTAWVDYDRSKGVLTLHILDLIDEATWIATVKGRYERYLLEIFE